MSRLDDVKARARDYPGVHKDSVMRGFIDAVTAWDGTGPEPVVPYDTNLWRWYDEAAKDRDWLVARVKELSAALDEMTGLAVYLNDCDDWFAKDAGIDVDARAEAARAALRNLEDAP